MSLRLIPQYSITHVLSVMKCAPSIKEVNPEVKCQQLCIAVDDTEEEDLLQSFQIGVEYIREGLAAGGVVLVHCIAGVSRSCTMVAAYLMVVDGMSAEEAVASIRLKRRVVQPNDGFLQQLVAWQEMGGKLDPSHHYSKQKALEAMTQQQLAGDFVEKGDLAVPKERSQAQETLYRCRKCRRLVATSANTAPKYQVSQPNGEIPTFSGKRLNSKDAESREATQLFVEPMQWMEEVFEGKINGKLYCPGCQARLGSFSWSGKQDNRGCWVTPAFELQLSKLDAMPSNAPIDRLHLPPLRSSPTASVA